MKLIATILAYLNPWISSPEGDDAELLRVAADLARQAKERHGDRAADVLTPLLPTDDLPLQRLTDDVRTYCRAHAPGMGIASDPDGAPAARRSASEPELHARADLVQCFLVASPKPVSSLALLNTSIITGPGRYTFEPCSLEDAVAATMAAKTESFIGHESTAAIMSELLSVDVQVNRVAFKQEAGQKALVFKLNGRPPEGRILSREEIEEIGYTWGILTRTQ